MKRESDRAKRRKIRITPIRSGQAPCTEGRGMENTETAGSERRTASRRHGGFTIRNVWQAKDLPGRFLDVWQGRTYGRDFRKCGRESSYGIWVVANGMVGCQKANRKRRTKHRTKIT